ncbi:MFS general substrate transporter [Xylariaceae sp. FL1272]|nr:MFS general substrate transporter [Xylariaceae sp. FL1272]
MLLLDYNHLWLKFRPIHCLDTSMLRMVNSRGKMATGSSDVECPDKMTGTASLVRHLTWTPPWLRWDSEGEHELTWGMSVLFGLTSAFTVANLYYTHPILNVLAEDFDVSYERAALIPSLTQAGYAIGLFFIIPLGDILRRRHLVLSLIFITSIIWLGSTLTTSFSAFLALSFITGILTVTPQLMFPLVVSYAAPSRRATMTSVVMSGVVFGILVARLLSGVITQYTSWRIVYYLALGLQLSLFAALFLCMEDYPVARPGTSYPAILMKIVTLPFSKAELLQMSLIAFLVMGMFTSFWTTLTFQLADVFHLSTLVIGLFALIGIAPVVLNPIVSRVLTSRVHTHGTILVALFFTEAVVLVGTFIGAFSLAGPVLWAFLGDLGMNTIVVGTRMAIAGTDPSAQNAVNAVYMVFTFAGQLFGTLVGNVLYARGGWIWSGALNITQLGLALLVLFIRGPHEKGRVGWRGGWDLRKHGETHRPGARVEEDREKGNSDRETGNEKGDESTGEVGKNGDGFSEGMAARE